MRPVNLIPPEERRGDQAPLRTGPLAYILLAGLALLLLGVVALVLTGNQVSEREGRAGDAEARRRGGGGEGAPARLLHPVPQPQRSARADGAPASPTAASIGNG